MKEQRSLCGHRTLFKEDGIGWEDFKKEAAWNQMKTKPYFYVLSVGPPGDPHEIIKFGISANSSPHGRLQEYYRFYSGKFKVHLILTSMQWKKDIPTTPKLEPFVFVGTCTSPFTAISGAQAAMFTYRAIPTLPVLTQKQLRCFHVSRRHLEVHPSSTLY